MEHRVVVKRIALAAWGTLMAMALGAAQPREAAACSRDSDRIRASWSETRADGTPTTTPWSLSPRDRDALSGTSRVLQDLDRAVACARHGLVALDGDVASTNTSCDPAHPSVAVGRALQGRRDIPSSLPLLSEHGLAFALQEVDTPGTAVRANATDGARPVPQTAWSTIRWACGGGAVVASAVGGYFRITANNDYSKYSRSILSSEAATYRNRALSNDNLANIFFDVAIGLGAAAILTWVAEGVF